MHFFPEIPQNRIYSYSVLFSFSNRSRAFFLEMPHFLCSFFLKRTENEYVRFWGISGKNAYALEFLNFCERANVFLDGIHEICSKLLKSLIYSI